MIAAIFSWFKKRGWDESDLLSAKDKIKKALPGKVVPMTKREFKAYMANSCH